ncbi:DUF6777 domain-containing protein [Streptomyces sp. NPDC006385]|uniref:DUF6777 domain-containing protein n=1 Tax=Streptomyces sp. NPDC006385 TaxID=3156761 RepID=UPI0033B23776
MTLRVCVRRAGKSVMRRIAVLLVLVLVIGGCDRDVPSFVVKAVAAGVPSLAPFFDEGERLGRDAQVRARTAHGGLQQGDTPGLYGGSEQPAICDVERLEEFLTDPAQERKARAWAAALSLTTAEIPDYLDRLTPVLLRHDTLVKNHDYKKGKAAPFHALLQAGIAVLVDERGIPAVKCSCGNPLRPFEGDTTRTKVEFDDRNEKWKGFEQSSVVAVRPATREVVRLALVDVQEPGRGINRPVGTTGQDDTTFDTRERRAVPDVTGTTFAQASRRLSDRGLAVALDGGGLPSDDARVTASDPPAGTELRFGAYVTLSVAGETSTGPSSTPPGSGTSRPSSSGSGGSRPGSPGPTSGPPSSGPASSAPVSSAPATPTPPSSGPPAGSTPPPSTKDPAPGSPPPSSPPPPPATGSPPRTTSPPPTSAPVTSSAPPPETGPPETNPPATSEPATGAPPSTAAPTGSTTA